MGEDYLKELFWEAWVEARSTPSFDIVNIRTKIEETTGYAIRIFSGTRKFAITSLDGLCALRLMIIVPKKRFTTKQEVEEHYKKVMQDYVAKIKYMVQVERMSFEEAVDIMNVQLNEETKGDIE